MLEDSAIPLLMLTTTLVVHLIATVWWAASLTKRVDHIERWINNNGHTAERLAAMEQRIESMADAVVRIEQHLRGRG